jgi:glycine cleavage system regulatory protein
MCNFHYPQCIYLQETLAELKPNIPLYKLINRSKPTKKHKREYPHYKNQTNTHSKPQVLQMITFLLAALNLPLENFGER